MRVIPILLAALYLSGCTTMEIGERNFIRPNKDAVARLDAQALLPGLRVSDEEIVTEDGAALRGVMAQREGAGVTVLYFGGNAFQLDRHGAALLPLLASCGAGVAVFDYRGYGRSSGAPTVATMAADAVRAYDHVSARSAGRVIVHGQSLGSFMAAHVVRQRPQASGLVLEATSTNVQDWAEANVPWYARPFLRIEIEKSLRDADNVVAVSGYRGPSLVLAGEHDRITPPALGQQVYAALPGPAKQWLVAPGAGHNTIFGHKDVMPAYCKLTGVLMRA
ncbi:alpha/beta hydrolase [Massilia eurypsychrophila]|jgi:pimeloyl-ACP methyl ester carboxylesterase|uniref:Alpha/beta hydrolase n=1 Tax=Massilia eurypsychrophila TaxID=1485217 RepID=A0A2G8TJZ3_9BURK|nr:alpha/beta fold hydrolase [Massilia eurypsychrophila]PIL46344.1 alpha/beta hydrolase [Massilia eurypsychrophila]